MKMMLQTVVAFTVVVATAGANVGLRGSHTSVAEPMMTDSEPGSGAHEAHLAVKDQADKLMNLLAEDESNAEENVTPPPAANDAGPPPALVPASAPASAPAAAAVKPTIVKSLKKKKTNKQKFKSACVAHTAALVRQMDRSYTDENLKRVLVGECILKKEFPKSVNTGFNSNLACYQFATDLVAARMEELRTGSTKGYVTFCNDFHRNKWGGTVIVDDDSGFDIQARAQEELEAEMARAEWAASGFQGEAPEGTRRSWGGRVVAQLIFAVLYYLLIVKHYPKLGNLQPNEDAVKLQQMNEVEATMHTSVPNCLLSWCCSGPRAAHTFYTVLGFNYWAGCVLMSCFPCCTLWVVNSFSKLNPKLGGEKRNAFMGLLCACFCSCCVIAQDAETLDIITGAETHLCSVTRNKAVK